MSRTLRGGPIGAGFFAQNQLHGWRDVADADIVAVCDLDRAKAVHIGDLAHYLLGPPLTLFADAQQIKPDIAGEDAATLILRHENGAASVVDISYASHRDPDPLPQTLGEIEGEFGSIPIEPGERLRIHARGETRTLAVKDDGRAWTSRPWRQIQDSVVHTQAHFIDSLRRGVEPETSARRGLTKPLPASVISRRRSQTISRPSLATSACRRRVFQPREPSAAALTPRSALA